MPGVYGPVIKPTSVSTRPPSTGGGGSSAPGPGSSGIGVGIKLPFGYQANTLNEDIRQARGGKVKAKAKKMAKGGSTASKRADGCATKGKTKGRFV